MSASPPVPRALTTRTRADVKSALLQLFGDARHAVAVHSRDLGMP